MKTIVWAIPGIHTKDPMQNIGRLKYYFEAFDLIFKLVDYGFIPLGLAWLVNWLVSRKLAKKIRSDKNHRHVIVAHSNGADIARRVANLVSYDVAVLINAALDSDVLFKNVNCQVVYYVPDDDVLRWAERIPGHFWGDMGRVGYTGPYSEKVIEFNCMEIPPKLRGHSDFFDYGTNLKAWGYHAANIVYRLQPHPNQQGDNKS